MKADASSFDYIVVGAGTAGCVLANRLSASGSDRVLLLEAGGHDRHIWIHIPLGYGKLFTNPKVNWLYTSEPEAELNNRRIQAAMEGKVWVAGCHNYFRTAAGKVVTQLPYKASAYWLRTRAVRPWHYRRRGRKLQPG